jgi:hypothetical protein
VVLLELLHVLARGPRHRAIAGVLLTHFAATAQVSNWHTFPIRCAGQFRKIWQRGYGLVEKRF